MTQVNSAQQSHAELALRPRADTRSLAQRRADFAAQMRAMALSDLQQVAERLKGLHERLERKESRKVTQQDLAREIGIPYRTYQAWAGAKNENRSGTGYDKVVRYYRRKLGDKTITRNWLVFGEDGAVRSEPMASEANNHEAPSTAALDAKLDQVLQELSELRSDLVEIGNELERRTTPAQSPPQTEPGEGSQGSR